MENPSQNPAANEAAQSAAPVPIVSAAFRAVTPRKNLIGFADVNIGGHLTVQDVKVLNGTNGIYAGMPSVQNKEGKFVEHCYPTTAEMRKAINDAVGEAYRNAVERSNGRQAAQVQPDKPQSTPAISLSVNPVAAAPGKKGMAYARMDVAGHFVVKNISIVAGAKGTFPSMPTVSDGKGGYEPVCKLSDELHKKLFFAARDSYKEAFAPADKKPSVLEGMAKNAKAVAAQSAAPSAAKSQKHEH